MAEATALVSSLLEICAREDFCEPFPAHIAGKMVAAAWAKEPSLYDGRFGQRPHKVSLAASAFAGPLNKLPHDSPVAQAFTVCLGMLLGEIERNGLKYPLTDLDKMLLEAASDAFMRVVREGDATPLGQEFAQFTSPPVS